VKQNSPGKIRPLREFIKEELLEAMRTGDERRIVSCVSEILRVGGGENKGKRVLRNEAMARDVVVGVVEALAHLKILGAPNKLVEHMEKLRLGLYERLGMPKTSALNYEKRLRMRFDGRGRGPMFAQSRDGGEQDRLRVFLESTFETARRNLMERDVTSNLGVHGERGERC
jgi:hypothetical protein